MCLGMFVCVFTFEVNRCIIITTIIARGKVRVMGTTTTTTTTAGLDQKIKALLL